MVRECREYMLHVLWRTMNPEDKVVFLDNSEQYFLPRLKFEKSVGGKLELLTTVTDVYRPVDESLVTFAYENTIKKLSDALCYSYEFDKVESLMEKNEDVPEHTLTRHKERLESLKLKSNIHVNQIKENYGDKQREDSEAIQEV